MYNLIDSGEGRKLEQFGPYIIDRPASQAVWPKRLPHLTWKQADARLVREGEGSRWEWNRLPENFEMTFQGIKFGLRATDFGHLGVFPEHGQLWEWAKEKLSPGTTLLNLFAYSGGMTLAAAKVGAQVCHLDASKGMVSWARENAAINHLEKAPIRWIIDDVTKFLRREITRGRRYDAIILDPPTFGRGAQGELFKIEEDVVPLLQLCKELLSEKPLFVVLSCHTPGFTPLVLSHLLQEVIGCQKIENGELFLPGELPLPSGCYARGLFR
jgi:23S rRNA (cytosine1962-C5)-methyltransferase